MRWLLRLVETTLRHRIAAAVVLGVSLVSCAWVATNIQFRFQFRDFYAYKGNPDLPVFDDYNTGFGDPGGSVILLLESDEEVFKRETLEYITSITKALQPNPTFTRIRSLSTVPLIRAEGDGVAAGELMERIPATAEEMAALKTTVLNSHLLRRTLISDDARTTAVLAEPRVSTATATIAEQRAAVDGVRDVLREHQPPPGVRASITGGPSIEVALTTALVEDQLTLTPAVLGIVTLMLILIFRSWHGVVLVLTTVGVSLVWTAGLFSLLGRPVDIVGSVIPTTLVVYGVVDPIFVLTRFLQKLEGHRSSSKAVMAALSEMILPCFLTSWTTALGFAAFITATMPTVQYLGIVVGAGVLFSFVTTITVLPLLLVTIPVPKRRSDELPLHNWFDRVVTRAWGVLAPRARLAAGLSIVALACTALAARGLQIDDAYVGSAPNGEARTAARSVERSLGGVVRYAVQFTGEPGSMKRPEVLRAIEAADSALERVPGFRSSTSLADLLSEANQAFMGGDVADWKLPKSSNLIGQYLALIDPQERNSFVNEEYSKTHIRVLAADGGGADARRLRAAATEIIEAQHFEQLGVTAHLTGTGVLIFRQLDKIAEEIIWGFVASFLVVLAFEFLLFRSFLVALASIVPNLIAIGACLVAMRVFGVGFRLDTSLVMCVSIGSLFNTTIHIAARVLQQLRGGPIDFDQAIENALKGVGPASLYTMLTLSLGFSALLLSAFPGLRLLAALVIVTTVSGFVSDMCLTPVFLRLLLRQRLQSIRPEPLVSEARA